MDSDGRCLGHRLTVDASIAVITMLSVRCSDELTLSAPYLLLPFDSFDVLIPDDSGRQAWVPQGSDQKVDEPYEVDCHTTCRDEIMIHDKVEASKERCHGCHDDNQIQAQTIVRTNRTSWHSSLAKTQEISVAKLWRQPSVGNLL